MYLSTALPRCQVSSFLLESTNTVFQKRQVFTSFGFLQSARDFKHFLFSVQVRTCGQATVFTCSTIFIDSVFTVKTDRCLF